MSTYIVRRLLQALFILFGLSGHGREGGAEGFEPFVETRYFCLGQLGLPLTANLPARSAAAA